MNTRCSGTVPGTANREFQTFSGRSWKLQVSKTTTNSRLQNTRFSRNVVLVGGSSVKKCGKQSKAVVKGTKKYQESSKNVVKSSPRSAIQST